jgi:hypothetical protein
MKPTAVTATGRGVGRDSNFNGRGQGSEWAGGRNAKAMGCSRRCRVCVRVKEQGADSPSSGPLQEPASLPYTSALYPGPATATCLLLQRARWLGPGATTRSAVGMQ